MKIFFFGGGGGVFDEVQDYMLMVRLQKRESRFAMLQTSGHNLFT